MGWDGLGYPKMDGENYGKPYFLMDDLGGKPTIFGNIHMSKAKILKCWMLLSWFSGTWNVPKMRFMRKIGEFFHFHDYGKKGIFCWLPVLFCE